MDNSTFIWNGNDLHGNENIQAFFLQLPRTEHTVHTFDVQPIIGDENLLLIVVSGVHHDVSKNTAHSFQQMFTLFAQDGKWKILTDNFRIQDAHYLFD